MNLNKTTSGIPLRQTNPASVEKYLIEKVRDDLGEYKDLAIIHPVLRVDSEDGDLSGNITNGFGNIMLDVRGVKVHVPFMIHDKDLIPFDVIRMGEQEVPYNVSAIRKIVNGIDKSQREAEDGQDEGKAFSIGKVVDRKVTPTGNGFLGTIMQMRDNELSRAGNGSLPFSGPDFGTMDDSRLDRYASAKVDVLEVFEEVVEKLAQVKSIPRAEVNAFIVGVAKQAAEESQKAIDAIAKVDVTDTLEAAGIRRGMTKLKDEKLADIARCASGNEVKFPIADGGRFEYRYGRVYHKIEEWAKNNKDAVLPPLKSVLVDSHNGYKLFKDRDAFMVTLEKPPIFSFRMERARGLQMEHMYAMEISPDTISHPFEVSQDGNAVSEFMGPYHHQDRKENSLFTAVFRCKEVMPSKEKEYRYTTNRCFVIIIPRDETVKEIKHLTGEELEAMIQMQAKDPLDARMANQMAVHHDTDYYLIPQDHQFYKLEKAIEGFFTKPDGYFSEGPMVKQAAYDDLNKCVLKLERDRQPRTYAIEYQFNTEEADGEGQTAPQTQKRELTGLSEAQARQKLQDLGFDGRQTEILFEYVRRNGRSATLALPDPEKARGIAPGDIGTQKSTSALKNILSSTFNADNFVPVLGDVMAAGLAGAIGNAAPQASDWARSVNDWFKTSFTVAVELEKIATSVQGSNFHELAALVNLKHRLDKVARDIAFGDCVSGMNDVFEKVASLQSNISDHTRELIDLNRLQILHYEKPIIAPQLIKQAIHELSGLYRYAQVHQEPENKKKVSVMGAMTYAQETMAKQADEGPHRSAVNFMGEHVVGRPSAVLLDLIPGHKEALEIANQAGDDVNDLVARLASTMEESGLGK